MAKNSASRDTLITYSNLRAECEKLLAIAARLELIGEKGAPVTTDPAFHDVAVQWRRQFEMVRTIGSVI